MMRRNLIGAAVLGLTGALCLSFMVFATAGDTSLADAAMHGDRDAVRTLLKQAVDVNASQGDGMTALHWSALKGDTDTVQMLVYAGANVKAMTRLGGYTPLFMAAQSGHAAVVDILLKAGANSKAVATDGMTPLMMAAISGDPDSVKLLLVHGAEANAKETDHGQTPLSFAAAFNRSDAIKVLIQNGADANLPSKVILPLQLGRTNDGGGAIVVFNTAQPAAPAAPGARGAAPAAGAPAPAAGGAAAANNGADAGAKGGGNPKGGFTPLMYAARQGNLEAANALLSSGANVNAKSADNSTALLLSTINGHFDFAKTLVDHNADVNIISMDGATPLYGVVNTQWARKSFHPQPTTRYEQVSYLDLMSSLLDRGADPNAKLSKELWYSEYNFSLESASAVGTTAFWKCAEVGDIDGMRLLVSRGADPNIASTDGVTPLLMTSGAGVHGNDDVTAPFGRLAAVKYLVEELHADVNAADTGGNNRVGVNAGQDMQVAATTPTTPAPAAAAAAGFAAAGGAKGGYTALHNAASRGDNEMILYLVAHGAKVDAVAKNGTTIVDMANGPRQRIQPYPETVALLEILGAQNNHKCVSC